MIQCLCDEQTDALQENPLIVFTLFLFLPFRWIFFCLFSSVADILIFHMICHGYGDVVHLQMYAVHRFSSGAETKIDCLFVHMYKFAFKVLYSIRSHIAFHKYIHELFIYADLSNKRRSANLHEGKKIETETDLFFDLKHYSSISQIDPNEIVHVMCLLLIL